MKFKVFESSEKNVWKYIFQKEDAITEAVLYKYNDFYERTVICCSVQSGCPVGCKFCGTGKHFVRNLTANEIVEQITTILIDKGLYLDIDINCKKLQFMFMSMGEPMLNWENVETAIKKLHNEFPNAQLLISTIGVDNDDTFKSIIELSKQIDKIGLQFSIHKSCDIERNELIPFKNKMNLLKLRDAGLIWWKETGRKVYLNYCVDGTNTKNVDANNLTQLFSPVAFCFTFSVICQSDETMKGAYYDNLVEINNFRQIFTNKGYNTRTFNPAGQDDIGGGCGQLWYVQKWLKLKSKPEKPMIYRDINEVIDSAE